MVSTVMAMYGYRHSSFLSPPLSPSQLRQEVTVRSQVNATVVRGSLVPTVIHPSPHPLLLLLLPLMDLHHQQLLSSHNHLPPLVPLPPLSEYYQQIPQRHHYLPLIPLHCQKRPMYFQQIQMSPLKLNPLSGTKARKFNFSSRSHTSMYVSLQEII